MYFNVQCFMLVLVICIVHTNVHTTFGCTFAVLPLCFNAFNVKLPQLDLYSLSQINIEIIINITS